MATTPACWWPATCWTRRRRTIWDYIGKESPAKYDMAVFGKWHLGGNTGEIQHVQNMRVPNFRGFLGAQVPDYYNWTAWDGNTGTAAPMTTYSTTALTNWAIDFIRWHEDRTPAGPVVPVPALQRRARALPGAAGRICSPWTSADWRPARAPPSVPVFKAMIQALDVEIGRLLQQWT